MCQVPESSLVGAIWPCVAQTRRIHTARGENHMQDAATTEHRVTITIRPRAFALVAAVLITLSLIAAASASAQSAPITTGAKWQDIPDLGVTSSHTYIYTPSVLFNPGPMLTPVLFVYS